MAAPGRTVVRVGRALERFVESRQAAPAVGAAALAVYALVSIGLPLHAGRDLARYLLTYAQLVDAHVVFPNALRRADAGNAARHGVAARGRPRRQRGRRRGSCTPARSSRGSASPAASGPPRPSRPPRRSSLYPGYVLLFHQLASDALFAAAFALVALLLARVVELPTALRAGALGLGVAAAVYVRPVGQVLVLLGLAAAPRGPWPFRVWRLVAAFADCGARAARLAGGPQRSARETTSRSSAAAPPPCSSGRSSPTGSSRPATARRPRSLRAPLRASSCRTSRTGRVGSSSRRSSRRAARRMHDDLTVLADRTWGWDDDYRHLGRVAREAILAHPTAYARGVVHDLWRLVLWPLYAPVEESTAAAAGGEAQRFEQATAPATDDEPIPSVARDAVHLDPRRPDQGGVDLADRPLVRLPRRCRPRSGR